MALCILAGTTPMAHATSDDSYVFRIGKFEATDTTPPPKHTGVALGLGFERRQDSGLRYGIEVTANFSDYATPGTVYGGPFTVIDDTMMLTTVGVAGTLAQAYSTAAVDLYAGGSAGLYYANMRAHGSTLGFPGTHDERDTGLGFSLFAGLEFPLGSESHLGLEVRRLFLDADFGPLSNGEMAIGGTAVLLSYRSKFAGKAVP
ncbi:MAG: hypothetical protein AB1450_02775 [Pseudomonadota bacterium]